MKSVLNPRIACSRSVEMNGQQTYKDQVLILDEREVHSCTMRNPSLSLSPLTIGWINGRHTWNWICQGANSNSHGDVGGGSGQSGGGTGSRSVGDRVKWGWRVITFAADFLHANCQFQNLATYSVSLPAWVWQFHGHYEVAISSNLEFRVQFEFIVFLSIMFLTVNCELRLLGPLHTHETESPWTYYTLSTLAGGKGGGVQVRFTLCLRDQWCMWMQCGCKSLRGDLNGIEWVVFDGHLDCFLKSPFEGRHNTKLGDHGIPKTHNHWFILFLSCVTNRMNRNSLK